MSALSLEPLHRQKGSGQKAISDHLMFLGGYAVVYVATVVIQVALFNNHRTGKGGGIELMVVVYAIPYLIGFVPMWWLSRFWCAGRSGWLRHGLAGFASGLGALGIFFGLITLGWI